MTIKQQAHTVATTIAALTLMTVGVPLGPVQAATSASSSVASSSSTATVKASSQTSSVKPTTTSKVATKTTKTTKTTKAKTAAKATDKRITVGQLTNKNNHRLAAFREAIRQQVLTQTHASASKVAAVYSMPLPRHFEYHVHVVKTGIMVYLSKNSFKLKAVTVPFTALTGIALNQYLPKENKAKAVDQKAAKKYVALTFDDGPDPVLTPKLLKTLAANHVHATFFEVGENVSRYPKVSQAVLKAGNQIGNHSWNHPDFNRIGKAAALKQLLRTDTAIYKATGQLPTTIRPPYGNITASIADAVDQPIIRWNVDSMDWSYLNTQKDINHVMATTHGGSIILMHDIHAQSVAAVPTLIHKLKAKGYKFVTLDQMFGKVLPHYQYFGVNDYRNVK